MARVAAEFRTKQHVNCTRNSEDNEIDKQGGDLYQLRDAHSNNYLVIFIRQITYYCFLEIKKRIPDLRKFEAFGNIICSNLKVTAMKSFYP